MLEFKIDKSKMQEAKAQAPSSFKYDNYFRDEMYGQEAMQEGSWK